ncbi:Cell cycle control protein 50A [Phytophthora boehmeriae]|uniref:Cell cycle control protein 50A n=1 Tax=Phytophthora boehmeriae TaxID=109152 RepID=A0A8T1WQK1_9STRA|nr:Cell cycle control protein 50A [Phytophthora boehmeriae]
MDEKSRKPEDTPFKQQKLKAWQPILTPNWVIGTFAVVGLIFIPIGIVLHTESDNVVEYSIQYDGDGMSTTDSSNIVGLSSSGCYLEDEDDGDSFDVEEHGCRITFKIDKEMKAPVYLYYQLDNFYQNHRRYVQSRSDAQLRGDASASTSDCSPLEKSGTGYSKYNSTATTPIGDNTTDYTLMPCGLIANSLFNDIFWVNRLKVDGKTYYQNDTYNDKTLVNLVDQTGIAWKSDVETKFKNIDTADLSDPDKTMMLWQNPRYRYIIPMYEGQEPIANKTAWTTAAPAFGVQDEHFIVWMRTAGLPSFRKLYGRIDTDLAEGTELEFLVSSNFVVSTFEGKKSIVISTTSWFGGRNPFLGIAYIIVGSLCMVLAILFFAKHKLSPRKLGDTRYLVWKNNH